MEIQISQTHTAWGSEKKNPLGSLPNTITHMAIGYGVLDVPYAIQNLCSKGTALLLDTGIAQKPTFIQYSKQICGFRTQCQRLKSAMRSSFKGTITL